MFWPMSNKIGDWNSPSAGDQIFHRRCRTVGRECGKKMGDGKIPFNVKGTDYPDI